MIASLRREDPADGLLPQRPLDYPNALAIFVNGCPALQMSRGKVKLSMRAVDQKTGEDLDAKEAQGRGKLRPSKPATFSRSRHAREKEPG